MKKIKDFFISIFIFFIALTSFSCSMDNKYKLEIKKNIDEAGEVLGSGRYDPYEDVNISVYTNYGYNFIGWYYNENIISYNYIYKFTMPEENVVIEARFKLSTYKLQAKPNNNNNGRLSLNGEEATTSIEKNFLYKEKIKLVAKSLNSTRFLGYYDNKNNLISNNPIFDFSMPSNNYYIEAKWNYFTITYNLNGGENNSKNPKYYTIEDEYITLKEPTRNGYIFKGWTYSGNKVSKIDCSIAKNIILDAVWECSKYSIYYELNGGINNDSSKL